MITHRCGTVPDWITFHVFFTGLPPLCALHPGRRRTCVTYAIGNSITFRAAAVKPERLWVYFCGWASIVNTLVQCVA